MPRYIEKPTADPKGLRVEADLPWALPYNLRPNDLLRVVEDLYEMFHEVNVKLVEMGYDRMEELLDSAGYSGFISRSVVDRLGRYSKALVPNTYPNGYPDLVPKHVYAGDRAQHGTAGGLEVKASRSEGSWQSHGPRAGWFCVAQFDLDTNPAIPLQDREPTVVQAMMIAELDTVDWSWQPAGPGRIRSGTASVKPSGQVKLRQGAVWVNPAYDDVHKSRLRNSLLTEFSAGSPEAVLAVLAGRAEVMTAREVAADMACPAGLTPDHILSRVQGALRRLVASGRAQRVKPGQFRAL